MPTRIGFPCLSRLSRAESTITIRAPSSLSQLGCVVRPGFVRVGDQTHGQRPVDTESRVVETKAPGGIGCVGYASKVFDFGIVGECLVAVSAAFRNVQHGMIVGSQFETGPMLVRCGVRTQIDDNIEDSASSAANGLGFL